MSGLIELFWRPQPKDVPSGLIAQQRYFERVTCTPAAAALLQAFSTVCPSNTTRVITHIAMNALPGAAQTVGDISVAWSSTSGFSNYRIAKNPPVGYPAATRIDFPETLGDGIWLRPGEYLGFSIQFNAGVAINNGNCFYYGYDIPIGNTL